MTLVVDVNVEDAWTAHARELALQKRRQHRKGGISNNSSRPDRVLKPSEQWLGWDEAKHVVAAKSAREAYHKSGSVHSLTVAHHHEMAAAAYARGDKSKARAHERAISRAKTKHRGRR